jgi:hypothetical protein
VRRLEVSNLFFHSSFFGLNLRSIADFAWDCICGVLKTHLALEGTVSLVDEVGGVVAVSHLVA